MTEPKQIRCKSMNSRRGGVAVIDVRDDDYDEHVTQITLQPDEVDEFIKRLRAAKEDAIVAYGRRVDPDTPPWVSPLP